MVCFINSDHVMFSREFAFCPFINYAYLMCTWMHAHRTKLERDTLPEIGDILRPRSIWHAVSNYQDGGIKKAVRRKNKDRNDTISKDLNQFNFFFEVVNTRENEKGETRDRAPVRMTILERRNNFVSCLTWQSKNNFQKSGPTVHLANDIQYNNNHI